VKCGLCGGGVRGYAGTLHGRPIKDWKHTSVPPGTEPHRPVLGTPVDEETLERQRQLRRDALEAKKPSGPPPPPEPPKVPPRLAKASEIPDRGRAMAELASDYGWTVEPPTYIQTAAGIEWLILRGWRRNLRFVSVWERRPKGTWSFQDGYTLAGPLLHQVGSKQLTEWITGRQAWCPDCGADSVVHTDQGECP